MKAMEIKVSPKKDGATITCGDIEITITVKPITTMARVQSVLSDYAKDLSISEGAEGIVIRPVGYLGKEKFAAISEKVRDLGGTYISAGKESRFVIPKK